MLPISVGTALAAMQDGARFGKCLQLNLPQPGSTWCLFAEGAQSHRLIGSSCELAEEQPGSISGGHVSLNHNELPYDGCMPVTAAYQWDSADATWLPVCPCTLLLCLPLPVGQADWCLQ